MKALVLTALNTFPSVQEVAAPTPLAGEVVVDVIAAALNRRDYWITQGQYPGIELPLILGSDATVRYEGEHFLVNPNVDWGENERVQSANYSILGLPKQGSFAEKLAISIDKLHPLPAHLTAHEGAALPLAGVTAYRALIKKCNPQPNEKVLITGIGGGVASFAFQFALAAGCQVWATSGNNDKIQQAVTLGAAGGANYRDDDWGKTLTKDAGGFDIIIDSAGGPGFATLTKIANPGARIAQYGGTRGKMTISPQLFFWKQLSFFGSTMGSDTDFREMLAFVTKHKITPTVDAVFTLEQSHAAFEMLEKSTQFGKVVFG